MLETLKKIGMEEKQAKLYLACLSLGATTIIEIARKTGIKRTTVYENLDEMVRAGYVKVMKKEKRKRYLALEPKELKDLIRRKEALLEQIMPQLTAMNNVSSIKPKVWFYEGKEGILEAYEDSLNYSNIEVVGFASGEVLKMFSLKEVEKYIARRQRKKIIQTLIMPEDKDAKSFIVNASEQLRRVKVVSEEEYPFKIEINIYANRLALFSVKDKMAVIMESEPISSAMRMIFRMCWKGID
ncbi:MAG: helix-turn-helix domain-containing protein [Parcubacteria group bacterium]|jgi:sugar-specific transcriptional regulator TrmB